jgi:S-DNA-T family DNA segregation ATPase FtsK/SpoIIIE
VARKTKKELAKIEENKRTMWLIVSLLIGILIVFTVFKMGRLGRTISNLLTYLLGSLYIIPLLCLFGYGVYYIFFQKRYPRSAKTIAGLYVANIFVILLNSFICDETDSLPLFRKYLLDKAPLVFGEAVLEKTGGLLGNLLYALFTGLTTRNGTLIIIVMALIIAAILIIPLETYRMLFHDAKDFTSTQHEELKKRREQQRIQAAKAEEERKARQAERMALLAEQEEAERQKREELARLKEERALEEERIRKEKAIEAEKIRQRESILSKSPTFINLNEKEIYGDRREAKVEKQEETVQTKTDILTEKKEEEAAPKTLRRKKGNSSYRLPKPYDDFLEASVSNSSSVNKTSAAVKGERVIEILKNFNIEAQLLNTYIGPSVTKFEIKPDSSVKINKIMNISDNIKMELAAKDIRIEAPIPGRSAVGIEIPNVEPIPVKMLDLIKNIPADRRNVPLLFALGKDLMGKPVFCDLAKMPHLLIAGATGSGKSVCINSIIISMLLRTHPDDVKLVLVDPKKVEFTPYKDIPHLLWPIIDDPQMASNMLKKVVVIMEERYDAFATAGVRNIDGFNHFVSDYNANLKAGEEPMNKLPYMVVIIDELADLMAIAGKDVELSIQRITQLARASGIHLIVATQRPSTDVITGLIKSNIPSRISFAVASSIDSRTILDQTGAERLLGNGDMLYYPQGETAPIRMQGVYVTDREIAKVTSYVKQQAKPEYEDSYYEFVTNMSGTTVMSNGAGADSMDSLYDEVVEFVRAQQKASTSLLQRRFGIGYNRAARLIDTLEDRGVIGPANGSKPREVYLKEDEEDI